MLSVFYSSPYLQYMFFIQQFSLTKQTSKPAKLNKFSIKPNPKIPINNAETTAPVTSVLIKVNAKNDETNVTNPPIIRHLPYSHKHLLVSFFVPKETVLYNNINVIIENIIPIISENSIISTAIVPVKNSAPITIPNITAIATGNIHTL